MKDQHMKSEKRSAWRVIPVVLLLLVLSVFAFAVSASADAQYQLAVGVEDLSFSGLTLDASGNYVKTYDGQSSVGVAIKQGAVIDGLQTGDDVTVSIKNATLDSANAGNRTLTVEFSLSGADAYKYAQPAKLILSNVVVNPVQLNWVTNGKASLAITYDPSATSYKLTPAQVQAVLPAIDAPANVLSSLNVTVTNVAELPASNAGTYQTTASVNLGNANYVIGSVPVELTVNPVVIDDIIWNGNTKWTYGTAMAITVDAYSGVNTYNVIRFDCADAKLAAGDVGSYTLVAYLTDDVNFVFSGSIDASKKTLAVTIEPKKYTVSAENVTVIGDETTSYNVAVKGDLPAEVLEQITYTVNNAPFTGTFQYGVFEVTVVLPDGNYAFYNANEQRITELTATLTVKRQQKVVPVYNESGEQIGSVILVNRDGFLDSVEATVTAIEGYPNIVKNNRYNQVYKIAISGAEDGAKFSIVIPIFDELLITGNDKLSLDHFCIYESASDTLIPASQAGLGYTVTLGEGYYQLDGFAATGIATTFAIAPDFTAPFFTTVPGILVIILIVLIVLLAMFYIGLLLRRRLEDRETVVVVTDAVEAEEEATETVEADATEQLEALAESVEAEEETVDETLVEEATEEALEDLATEISETDSDDAVEAMVVVGDADEDEEEDDDLYGFVNADPSTFIDVKEYPEEYAAMLERERLGEIRIVSRYKKSFTAKVAQSLGNVQDYYSAIKNALLSYKGVKGRVSWNYEAFNKGRAHVAKIDAKSKSLYLYLALNPEELVDTKYNFVDVSAKKKYASTPVLMKIKGERKFKHALELIEKLCGEQMALAHLELDEVDYKVERMTIEELVDAGFIKHLAGYILLVDEPAVDDEAVADEAAADEAPVAEESATEEAVTEDVPASADVTEDTAE